VKIVYSKIFYYSLFIIFPLAREGKSKGFGFVSFRTEEEFSKAL